MLNKVKLKLKVKLYPWNNCLFQEDDDATQIGEDLDEWMQVVTN